MLAAVAVAAATVTSSGTPTSVEGWAISQGPLGVLVLCLIVALRFERKRADAERAGSQALARELVDTVLPALAESTQAIRDLVRQSEDDRPRRNRG